jgi:hypothetical protein
MPRPSGSSLLLWLVIALVLALTMAMIIGVPLTLLDRWRR